MKPPYRESCASHTTFKGCCFQHSPAHVYVDKYTNTTVVDNWDTEAGGTISPYERWTPDPGSGDCEVHFCVAEGAPCIAWPKPYTANSFTIDGQVDFAVAHKRGFKNVQAARSWHGAFGWLAPEYGCKTVLCSDGVSGFQAYQSTASQTKYLVCTYDVHLRNHFDAGENAGGYYNADKTGARTVNANSGEITSTLITSEEKAANFGSGPAIIRHVEGGAGYTDVDGDGTHESDFDHGGTTILDDLDNDLHCVFPHFRADDINDLPGFISAWNAVRSTPMPLMTDPNSYSCSISSTEDDGDWTIDATFSRSDTVVSWHFTITQDNGTDEVNTWEYYGTITLSSANTVATVIADMATLLNEWNLADDSQYPWRTDFKVSLAPYMTRNETDNTNPIGFNTYVVEDPTSPGTYIPWFDDRVYDSTGTVLLFDGSILGSPKPAGYQNYFDFGFIDVRGCCNRPGDGSQTWTWYQVGWGQDIVTFNSNSGCHIPLNATQWNNWFNAANKPAGAWIFYADKADYFGAGCVSSSGHSAAGDAGKFVAQKWAEIADSWPSQNFAMPAGDAKFWYDETRVYCATNASGSGEGSTWNITDAITGLAPDDSTDFGGIWGGPVVDGFYEVASYSSGVLTLGAKQFDLPSNWVSKSHAHNVTDDNYDDDFCFGKLRWSDKPSLLGRIPITPDGLGTTFTFSVAQPAFGMDSSTHQEPIDLYDATFSLIASAVTATRVDDTHFTTGSSYPTARWVQIHGAAKYYMNDIGPKGDFTVLEWMSDFRSYGEYGRLTGVLDCDGNQVTRPTENAGGGPVEAETQFASFSQIEDCLPFTPCAPRVICISPNGETFPNGITYDFPETYTADEQYGSKWWKLPQVTMTDLFWQTPHRPCNIEDCARWIMDDGTCHNDEEGTCPAGEETPAPTYYFGQAPQVEARLTVPANYGMAHDESAPALPSGIQIGWLSPVDNTTGDIALPPVPPGPSGDDGVPLGAVTPWGLHDALCANLGSDGCRFGYDVPGC